MNMCLIACELVRDYVLEHIDKTDKVPSFEVYVVWQCKTLQNWKFLISTDIPDGMYYELTFNGDESEWYLDAYNMYYELTFNGDESEWYLDAYKKFENRCIPNF